MLGHFAEGLSWVIEISSYIIFSLIVCFLLKSISKEFHCYSNNGWKAYNKDLYILQIFLLFAVIVIFSSFRYIRPSYQSMLNMAGGADSVEYRRLYNLSKGLSYFEALKAIEKEWLFVFVFWVFRNLGISFEFCLVFINFLMFLTLIFYSRYYNLSKNIIPILALICIYLGSLNTLRWSFTLLMSIFYISAMEDEKIFRAICCAIILSGVQFAASVLFIPIFIYFLSKKYTSKVIIYICFLIFCFVFLLPAFFDITFILILAGRNNQSIIQGQIPTTWLIIYTFYIINVFYVRKDLMINKKNINSFYTILLLIPPIFLELFFGLAYRFAYYGHPGYYMYFYRLYEINKKRGFIGYLFNIIHELLIMLTIIKYFGGTIEASGVPYKFGIINYIYGE